MPSGVRQGPEVVPDSASGLQALGRASRPYLAYLQLRPFDTASQTGRSHERHRRVAWTALTSAMAQAMSLVTLLITAPLSLDYLGVERYGLLITITSFAALFNFADLGIGNGLINAVSSAHGRDDPQEVAVAVSSAFFVLCAVALIL